MNTYTLVTEENFDSVVTHLANNGFYTTGGYTTEVKRSFELGQIQITGEVTPTGITGHLFATDITSETQIIFDADTYKINIYYEQGGTKTGYTAWITTSPYTPNQYAFDRLGINIRRIDSAAFGADELTDLITTAVATPETTVGNLVTKESIQKYIDGVKAVYPDGFTSRIKPDIYYNGRYNADIDANDYKIDGTSAVWVATDGSDSNDGTESAPFLTIEKAVASGAATIYLEAGTYIYGTNFQKYVNTSKHNLIGIGDVVLDFNGYYPLYNDNAYVENITFTNGSIGSCVCQSDEADKLICFVNCNFTNSPSANGLTVKGMDCICISCTAHGNTLDGFNYHAYNGKTVNALEIDCNGYDNATSSNNSCNGSTSHDGTKIIRINGEHYDCHGGIIADISTADGDAGWSLNYGVLAHDSTITTGEFDSDYTSASFWASLNVNMYLYDCKAYGGIYDLSCTSAKIVSKGLTTGRDTISQYNSNGSIIIK